MTNGHFDIIFIIVLFLAQCLGANRSPTPIDEQLIESLNKSDVLDFLNSCQKHITLLCYFESSCLNSCGGSLSNNSKFLYTCSCDAMCLLYDDCCFDFERMCPAEIDKFNRYNVRNLLGVKAQNFGSYLALSSCAVNQLSQKESFKSPMQLGQQPTQDSKHFRDDVADVRDDSGEDDDGDDYEGDIDIPFGRYVLVTDKTTGLTYSSENVYRCNNPNHLDGNMVKWEKKYRSAVNVSLDEIIDFLTNGKSSETFQKALLDVPPASAVLRLSPPETTVHCNLKCGQHHNLKLKNFHRVCKKHMKGRPSSILSFLGVPSKDSFIGAPSTEKYQFASPSERFLRAISAESFTGVSSTESYTRTSSTKCSSKHAYKKGIDFAGSRIKRSSPMAIAQQCSTSHIFRKPYSRSDYAPEFSALLSLSGSTKTMSVESSSNYFTGGWNKYICKTNGGQGRCQMTFSCNQNYVYVKDRCVKPKAICITIRPTSQASATPMISAVTNQFLKRLGNHKGMIFESEEHLENAKGDIDGVNYVLLVNPQLSVVSEKDPKLLNRYKDIIGEAFDNVTEYWVGKVTSCYFPHGYLMHLNDTIKFLKEENTDNIILCEDVETERKNNTQFDIVNASTKGPMEMLFVFYAIIGYTVICC